MASDDVLSILGKMFKFSARNPPMALICLGGIFLLLSWFTQSLGGGLLGFILILLGIGLQVYYLEKR